MKIRALMILCGVGVLMFCAGAMLGPPASLSIAQDASLVDAEAPAEADMADSRSDFDQALYGDLDRETFRDMLALYTAGSHNVQLADLSRIAVSLDLILHELQRNAPPNTANFPPPVFHAPIEANPAERS